MNPIGNEVPISGLIKSSLNKLIDIGTVSRYDNEKLKKYFPNKYKKYEEKQKSSK